MRAHSRFRSREVRSLRCCLRIGSDPLLESEPPLPSETLGRHRDAVLPAPVRAGRALHRPGPGRGHRRAFGPSASPVSAEVPGCCRGQAGKEMLSVCFGLQCFDPSLEFVPLPSVLTLHPLGT